MENIYIKELKLNEEAAGEKMDWQARSELIGKIEKLR